MEYGIGYFVGITQTAIGYPFDTLKTRKQLGTGKISNSNVLKGIRFPLFNSTLINTITFGNRSYFKEVTGNPLLSSFYTGLINGFVQNQLDYLKVKSQSCPKGSLPNIPRKLVFTGLKYSMILEGFSIPIYFWVFEKMHDDLHYSPFFSGGMAGINSWFWLYPVDTLKTRSYLNPNLNFKELISLNGESNKIKNMYRGLNIALTRAFLVNGFSFWVYNFLSDTIKNDLFYS